MNYEEGIYRMQNFFSALVKDHIILGNEWANPVQKTVLTVKP